jgi:peptidoglycan hydrolase-like protein with peptidoglycan-binding domain/lysophospholipase L1-like esterase
MIRLKNLLIEATEERQVPNVLFIGDSQTAADWSYARKLLASKLVTGKVIAKNGASTGELVNMLANNLSDSYDIVSIMGGGNDAMSKTPMKAIANFERMIRMVKKAGAKLVMITNPTKQYIEPGDKYYSKEGYPSNDAIADWTANESGADVIIDTQPFDKLDFTKDHVHLDADAHKKIASDWMNSLSLEKTGDTETETLKVLANGDSGSSVGKVQAKLLELGFDIGKEGVDNKFGPNTEKAVKLYQASIGAKPTGQLDDLAVSKLLNAPIERIIKQIVTKLTKKDDTADTADTSMSLGSILGKVVGGVGSLFAGDSATSQAKPSSMSSTSIADANTVIDFFTSKGLTPEQAAGIAGNIKAESEFNPMAIGDSGKAKGLAQWRDNRRKKLEKWTAQNGLDADSVDGQLKYLWWELNNSEKNALSKLKQQKTPSDAAYAFAKYFERPKHINPIRKSAAETFFSAYK